MGLQTPPDLIQFAQVTLSSAQLLALNTSPPVIVPAPGAGKAILVLNCWYSLTFGTAQYADASTLGLGYLGVGTPIIENSNAGVVIKSAASRVGYSAIAGSTSATAAVANQAVVMISAANPTTGDGTAIVAVAYVVVSV